MATFTLPDKELFGVDVRVVGMNIDHPGDKPHTACSFEESTDGLVAQIQL